jgi:hypothetical protein
VLLVCLTLADPFYFIAGDSCNIRLDTNMTHVRICVATEPLLYVCSDKWCMWLKGKQGGPGHVISAFL